LLAEAKLAEATPEEHVWPSARISEGRLLAEAKLAEATPEELIWPLARITSGPRPASEENVTRRWLLAGAAGPTFIMASPLSSASPLAFMKCS
jgi:hypothetical protein